MTREVWFDIEGNQVEDLTDLPRFHGGADLVEPIDGAVAPSNAGDYYGSRLRGYVIAPVTGDYTFWESGDGSAQLLLAPDADKFGAEPIAWHSGWTDPQQWDKFETQRSNVIRLEAGSRHYVELRHKEGNNVDHLAMAWAYQEVQSATNLALLPGAVASQSTTYVSSAYGPWLAEYAIDGNTGGDTGAGELISHTKNTAGSWWQVDLGSLCSVERIVLWNRDGINSRRLSNFRISLLGENGELMHAEDFFTDGTSAGRSMECYIPGCVNAQTVKIERLGPSPNGENIMSLAEVEVFGEQSPQPVVNLTQFPGVVASQSTTYVAAAYGPFLAEYAIDGNTDGNPATGDMISHTKNIAGSWWQVDLGGSRFIDKLVLWNRDGVNGRRLSSFRIRLIDDGGVAVHTGDFFTDGTHAGDSFEWDFDGSIRARTVKIERLGPSPGGENIMSLAEVEVFGITDRLAYADCQVIPSECLESYDNNPADLDDDDLYDAWEQVHGFDTATWQDGDYAFGADPDGDLVINELESRLNLDPFEPDSLQGFLTLEQWSNVPYYTIMDAAANSDKVYQEPDKALLVAESGTGERYFWYGAQRLRGYVVAPESGAYHFWLSATNGARLLISTGEDKYHKRIIAEMGPEMGTDHGIWYHAINKWDMFVSQMSDEIDLEAGHKYFIEVIHQHGHGHLPHASLAWARPGAGREEIPLEFLHSYFAVPGDGDDDSLPDHWETRFGLSASDNGLLDRSREGEHGDLDRDGLSNHEEYLLGTNPANADTDGDGLSDRDELRTYGTDPNTSDASPEQLVGTVAASSVAEFGDTWTSSADGVITTSFRGLGTWTLSVPSDGYWVLQVEARLRGDLQLEETVPVQLSLDGRGLGTDALNFFGGNPGSLRILTPWLTAGSHQLGLFIDNYSARRSVEITAIRILQPGGLDLDGNGRSDAVEKQLVGMNHVAPHAVVESCVSPAFIEGAARSLEGFELRIRHEGPGSTIRHKDSFWDNEIPKIQTKLDGDLAGLIAEPGADRGVAGEVLPVQGGPGQGTWYAQIPLNTNQATGYSAFFENGSLAEGGVVVWRPINLFETEEVTIPVGCELLMGAWDRETDNSVLTFDIGGEINEIRAQEAFAWLFDTAGDHTVGVVHEESGEVLTLLVHVREAVLPEDLAVAELRYRVVSLPGVDPDLALDAGDAVGLGALKIRAQGGSEVELEGRAPGHHRLAARLAPGAAILDIEEVTVVGIADAMRHLSDVTIPLGDDLYRVRSPLLVTNLPPGGSVEITIFAGGVTFPDGTTVKTLTAEDFDENGVYLLEFIMPAERLGAHCHNIRILDAAGNQI